MNKVINNKFLIKTDCSFLIENFIEKLKNTFSGYVIVSCDTSDSFIEKASAVNIFNDDKRMLILKDLDADSLDAIGAIVDISTDDVWIIIQRQTVSRTKSYTNIKGACQLIELKDLNESQCAVWVRQWLTELKLVFPEEIPSYIVSRVGTDITKLHNELKKVAAYYTESKDQVLTQLTCDDIFSEDVEAQFFVIVENFFRKRIKEVMEDVKKIDEYSLVKLLHMLIGQAEKLYKVAIYREQKMSPDDIGNMLSVPKFIVTTKFFSYLSFYNKVKLIMLLDLFNTLDIELRLSKYPAYLVFESYLLKAMRL
jgi:DNA polymerase III delta subunit